MTEQLNTDIPFLRLKGQHEVQGDCFIRPSDFFFAERFQKKVEALKKSSPLLAEAICFAQALGLMEPAEARRPGAGNAVTRTRVGVTVPRATVNPAQPNIIIPGVFEAFSTCPPMGTLGIAGKIDVIPANTTAISFGRVFYQHMIVGVGKDLCVDWNFPDCPGFVTTAENFFISPTGIRVFLQNRSRTGEALFSVEAEIWPVL